MSKNTIELKVEGMTCVNCARTVTRFLERKGMKDVYVNVTTHDVQFNHENKEISLLDIKSGIHKLGFSIIENETDSTQNTWTLERKFLISAIFTLPLFLGHLLMMFINLPHIFHNMWFQMAMCLPVYIIGVSHFGQSAWFALKMRNTNMDVLIFLGSTAAFIYSVVGLILDEPNYIFFETAATIITLVLLGNLMEKRAVQRTGKAIEELNNLQVSFANKVKEDGSIEKVDIKDLKVGDVLQVNEGDAIPTDGIVSQGTAYLDESMLTGESEYAYKQIGDDLTGASLVNSGNFQMKVTAVGKDTVLNKIIQLVKNAQTQPTEIQRLADRISEIFVPLVVGIAILTLLISYYFFNISFTQALMNAIAVLVISCPCAMGLATPAAIMVGIGRAAKEGILIKGSRTLEILAQAKNIVFDKTGTLTEGKFSISNFNLYNNANEEEVKAAIISLEQQSSHPIAQSLLKELETSTQLSFSEVKETKGTGLSGIDENNIIWQIGSYKIAKELTHESHHNVYVLKDKELVATLDLEDKMKDNVSEVMKYLKQEDVNTYLLSGDKKAKVEEIAKSLDIQHYEGEKMPHEKHERIKSLKNNDLTVMVGDGINDAAALALADVGMTYGSASSIAVQSASVVLLNDQAESIARSHKIATHTLKTIKENLFWAFAYNIVAIPIAALGFLNPMWAALFMAFSDVVVIGNSLRLRVKRID